MDLSKSRSIRGARMANLASRSALRSRSSPERRQEVTMPKLDAHKAGSFKIGGEIEIHRLGFGAMRITGPRVWGPPVDMAEAIRTLKRLFELGIDFIDTPIPTVQKFPSGSSMRFSEGRIEAPWSRRVGARRPPGILAPAGDQEPGTTWARTDPTLAAAQHRSESAA